MTPSAERRPRSSFGSIAAAAIGGGLLSGALDLLYASVAYPVSFKRVLQSIASGWMGPAAYRGGDGAVLLGLTSHFAILVVASGLYAVAARRFDRLGRRPVLGGSAYGAAIFVVMNYVVVPVSRATVPPATDVVAQFPHLLAHMLLVGPPIAAAAWWCSGGGEGLRRLSAVESIKPG